MVSSIDQEVKDMHRVFVAVLVLHGELDVLVLQSDSLHELVESNYGLGGSKATPGLTQSTLIGECWVASYKHRKTFGAADQWT